MSYRKKRKQVTTSIMREDPDDWNEFGWWGRRWFRSQEEVLEDMTSAILGQRSTPTTTSNDTDR